MKKRNFIELKRSEKKRHNFKKETLRRKVFDLF